MSDCSFSKVAWIVFSGRSGAILVATSMASLLQSIRGWEVSWESQTVLSSLIPLSSVCSSLTEDSAACGEGLGAMLGGFAVGE